jgi:hypothetical protein
VDADLKVTFNGAKSRLSFVQGEDRSEAIIVQDANTGEPVDLTGATAVFAMPAAAGGAIKRYAGVSMAVPPAAVTLATGAFAVASHGLVTGDIIQVAAAAGGTLPAGVLPGTNYSVMVIDPSTFSLLAPDGSPVVPTTQGTGGFTFTNGDMTVDVPTQGHLTCNLRGAVTQAVRAANAQDMQLNIMQSGKTRIAVIKAALDVYPQAEP